MQSANRVRIVRKISEKLLEGGGCISIEKSIVEVLINQAYKIKEIEDMKKGYIQCVYLRETL